MSLEGHSTADADLRPGRRSTYWFGVLFVIAAALTAVTVWLAARAPGLHVGFGRPLAIIYSLLGVNAAVILAIAALVGRRLAKLFRSSEVGARLHVRFMTLFALAAVVPAVVVAVFFGVLVNQGIDSWFSTRIRTVVDSHAAIDDSLVQAQGASLIDVASEVLTSLNEGVRELKRSPEQFDALMAGQPPAVFDRFIEAHVARNVLAIHIIDRDARILAAAAPKGSPRYLPPKPQDFALADQKEGASAMLSQEEDLARIVFALPEAKGAYVVVTQPMPPGLLARLAESRAAVKDYKEADANRAKVQTIFMLSYVESALIVLIGAIWLGLAAASAISEPVARLVKAANQVAAGDLDVRVQTGSQLEEIETLSQSFNKMTDDLKRQQRALRAATIETENRRQFIEAVLSGVSAGVIGLDPTMNVSASNRQAHLLLGLPEGGALGASLAEVAPEFVAVAERAALAGADAEEEIDIMRGSEVRRLRVRAGGDPKEGLVLTFDDITRLVAAQRNAAWKDVARRIAHEIKNPLTPIQLSAERLRRKYRKEITSDLETFDRCTDTIVRQVGDIGRMVDEFSAFARMPAPKFSSCDAAELLREAVFARRVANPDIEIELEDAGGSGPVVCDDRMIGQALANVLKNAAEAVEARVHAKPGVRGRIVTRLKSEGENLVYEVEDNGVGLPAKDRARLTEPYVTTREKGTGLGLAIVKRILEDHGGALTLRDAANGEGALVILSFPRAEGQTAPAPVAAEA